jgi:hypothetical protein
MGRITKALAKEIVLNALDELSEEKLVELIDFTEFILSRAKTQKLEESLLDPDKDPILRLIGLADVEPFADKIDDDLYGIRS